MNNWGIAYITTQNTVGKAKKDKIITFQKVVPSEFAAAAAKIDAEHVSSAIVNFYLVDCIRTIPNRFVQYGKQKANEQSNAKVLISRQAVFLKKKINSNKNC